MSSNTRFVVLGDLVADLYYNGTKLIGIDGGSSRFNVIANLATMGCNTAAIGGCGNDKFGKTILKRYSNLGVDVSNVKIKDKPIRAYNLIINQAMLPKLNYECSKISPVNYQNTWYEDSIDDIEYCKKHVNSGDVVVLDKLDDFSISIINDLNCNKAIDIGTTKMLEKMDDNQIMELKGKLSLLQFNERVIPYIMQRFEFTGIPELYKLFKPKLMIITKGREGADFLFENGIMSKKITRSTEEIDPTGAGDAFFSVFIKEYFNNQSKVNEGFINETFQKAINLTSDVVRHIGARGHMYDKTLEKDTLDNNDEEERK